MALLLLDPIALALLLGLVVYIGSVWRGRFRRWLGRDGWWTVLAWPVPVLVFIVPLIAGATMLTSRQLGIELGEDGIVSALIYMGAYLLPLSGLALLPPRWLLPRWARQRLASPPVAPEPRPDAVAALQSTGAGHGSFARWVWRVDAVPGIVHLDGGRLRFDAVDTEGDPGVDDAGRRVLDDDEIDQLQLSTEGELRLEPPRGGWWTRHHLDIDLPAVDRWRIRARRPWHRDGVLILEVDGRRPVTLWLADANLVGAHLREHQSSQQRRTGLGGGPG